MRRPQSITSATPTSTFLGSHPRSAHVPPNGLESTIATCHPAKRHRDATADAAVPVPIAIRSNFFIMVFLYVKPSSALEEAHVESGCCVGGADYRCARRIPLFRKRAKSLVLRPSDSPGYPSCQTFSTLLYSRALTER